MTYKYKGGGFIPGVPARDLTDEEAQKFGIKRLTKSGLYVKVSRETETYHSEVTGSRRAGRQRHAGN